ncbi:MAG: hydrogenase maturation protease [Bacteroidota bacterium]
MALSPGRSGKVLLLGIGNDILSDDAIGIRLIEDIQQKSGFRDVVFETAMVGGLEILELIQGYSMTIFFDAIRTTDGRPGETYRMSLEDFNPTLHLSNLHDISFIQAINLGKALGLELPAHIGIFAVEIVEDTLFSKEISRELSFHYPQILTKALDFLESMLAKYQFMPSEI